MDVVPPRRLPTTERDFPGLAPVEGLDALLLGDECEFVWSVDRDVVRDL